jgi:hypothetical protein
MHTGLPAPEGNNCRRTATGIRSFPGEKSYGAFFLIVTRYTPTTGSTSLTRTFHGNGQELRYQTPTRSMSLKACVKDPQDTGKEKNQRFTYW